MARACYRAMLADRILRKRSSSAHGARTTNSRIALGWEWRCVERRAWEDALGQVVETLEAADAICGHELPGRDQRVGELQPFHSCAYRNACGSARNTTDSRTKRPCFQGLHEYRGQDLNLRPPGYEPPRSCTRVPPYSAKRTLQARFAHGRCISAEQSDIAAEARCLQSACSWRPSDTFRRRGTILITQPDGDAAELNPPLDALTERASHLCSSSAARLAAASQWSRSSSAGRAEGSRSARAAARPGRPAAPGAAACPG